MFACQAKATPSMWWMSFLLCLACEWSLAPEIYGQTKPAAATPVPKKGVPKKPSKATPVEILVVGPNDEPVPYADVELRAKYKPDATWVLNGTHEKQMGYGSVYKADSDGRLVLLIPTKANAYFYIEMNGFRPFHSSWENSDPPRSTTMKLDAGQSIGGTVVDEAGNPIVGASISPGVTFKMDGERNFPLYVGREMKTNDRGRWFYGQVPIDLESMSISVKHPSYKMLQSTISVKGFSMKNGLQASAKLVMEKGLSMKGRITDSKGLPIENVSIRTREKKIQTDADGRYELPGCEVERFRIVIDSPGLAMRIEEVDFTDTAKSHDYVMQPGSKLRIRVIDENDKPVPRAWVFFRKVNGNQVQYFEFDHLKRNADENGIWEWNEAPSEELSVDIGAPNGTQLSDQLVTARPEEYVFKTYKAMVVVGQVIDAESKTPIDDFQVTPGIIWENGGGQVTWQRHGVFLGRDGKFEFTINDTNRKNQFRIEADGYVDLISPEVTTKPGRVPMAFEMKRGVDIELRILSPDKLPVVDVPVVMGSENEQIGLTNGVINENMTYARRKQTDQDGRVRFPQPGQEYYLVAANEAGYALVRSDDIPESKEIVLNRWAGIEGVYRRAGQSVANEKLSIYNKQLQFGNVKDLHIHSNYDVITGPDGSYRVARLFPGEISIARTMIRMMNQGSLQSGSSYQLNVVAESGKTIRADFEGDGTRLVGQLVFPKDFEQEGGWTYCTLNVIRHQPQPAIQSFTELAQISPEIAQKKITEWMQSAAGKIWQTENERWAKQQRTMRQHNASIERDGKFSVDDVVPGDYIVSVQFWQGDRKLELRDCKLTVTDEDSKNRREIDLGRLELQPIASQKQGVPFLGVP